MSEDVLYLVHHADAVGPEVDPQRPLSTAGRMHADALARKAKERGVAPAAIRHSGKLRAKQTAEAFWRACNPLAEFSAVPGLQPMDHPQRICELVVREERDVMLVGHMPSLARLLNLLVHGKADAESPFPPHGIVALEAANERWVERWRF